MDKYFVIVLALFIGFQSMADDSPDTNIEKKLSERYKAIGHQGLNPTDEGDWLMVSGQTPHKTYVTKKKESLMEVSEMLFGDPHFWTKLWSVNKNISNPYEVPAGTVITVTEATPDLPPSLGVSFDAKVSPEKLGNTAGPDLLSYSLNVEIPPNSHEKASPIDEIPSSLPSWNFRKDASYLTKMDLARPIISTPVPIKNLDFFVTEDYTDSDGEIIGTELNMKSAGEFQYVFVRFKDLATEKNYTVIKDIGEIDSDFTKRKPVMVEVLGSVEILDQVDSKKGIYRAMIKKAIANVEVGAKLVAGPMPTFSFTTNDALSVASATIIGGHFSTSRHLFGTENVVFLDHGQKEGISEGQMLPVYQFQRAKLDGNFVKQNPRMIGQLKVVKTSNHFATAVVVNSSTEIEVGDGTSPDLK